jgi:hypothetical protein
MAWRGAERAQFRRGFADQEEARVDAQNNVSTSLVVLPSLISAVSGLVGVIVGAGITWWREASARQAQVSKDAEYLAIQVSSRLDAFVSGWASVAGDDGLNEGQRTTEGLLEEQEKIPVFAPQELSVNWKALPIELMGPVLELPQRAETAVRELVAGYRYTMPFPDEDYFAERQALAVKLGLEAADLNDKLRAHVGLSPRAASQYDSVAFLREVRERLAPARA